MVKVSEVGDSDCALKTYPVNSADMTTVFETLHLPDTVADYGVFLKNNLDQYTRSHS
jgi:hypothetical protein